MQQGIYNLPDVYQGDHTSPVRFTLSRGNEESPVDLTGASIVIAFRQKKGTVSFRVSTDSGKVIISNPTQGMFTMDSFRCQYPYGEYDYDIRITFSTGVVKSYVRGVMRILKDVAQ